MKAAKMQLEDAQRKVEAYAVEWRDLQTRMRQRLVNVVGEHPADAETCRRNGCSNEVTLLENRYNAVKSDRNKMGLQVLNIQRLRQQREDAEKDKAEVQRLMDTLKHVDEHVEPAIDPGAGQRGRSSRLRIAGWLWR